MNRFSVEKASLIVDTFFVLLFIYFIYSQISGFLAYHVWSLLVFAFSETVTLFLFFFRSKTNIISDDIKDYMVAVMATLAPLLFYPFVSTHIILGNFLIFFGLVLQITSLFSLNTSFGVAPANRGVKTSGLYKFVRHPMYASYFILYIGYLLNNQTSVNFFIFIVAIGLQIWRIENEERLLSRSEEYKQYKNKIPWKLIPYVF